MDTRARRQETEPLPRRMFLQRFGTGYCPDEIPRNHRGHRADERVALLAREHVTGSAITSTRALGINAYRRLA